MSQEICIYITHGGISSLKVFAHQYRNKNPSEQQILATFANGIFTVIPGEQQYSHADFVDLVSNNTIVRLCCDSNLGVQGGNEVQSEVRSLVRALQPQELLLFASTPDCTSEANQNYIPSLIGTPTNRAIAVERMQMNDVIRREIPPLELTTDNVETVSNEMHDLKTSSKDIAHPVLEKTSNQPQKPSSCIRQCLNWLFESNKVKPDNSRKKDGKDQLVMKKVSNYSAPLRSC